MVPGDCTILAEKNKNHELSVFRRDAAVTKCDEVFDLTAEKSKL